mgnify:CR=1 FL=1
MFGSIWLLSYYVSLCYNLKGDNHEEIHSDAVGAGPVVPGAAAERAAATRWELSEREQRIIASLS